jgi:hypothetical protein
MGKYLFAYRGGMTADTDEQRQAAMQAWGGWFGELGPAVVDPGNPFAGSTSVGDGGGGGGGAAASELTGYSVINADSIEAASALAEGCPVLKGGGSVDVYETIDVSI